MPKLTALFQRGLTVIELLITLAVIVLALGLATPMYFEWLQNAQIRTASETMLVGVKLARAEALKRNTAARFQLMTTIDASCAPLKTAANWVVSIDDAAGSCDVTDSSAAPQIVRIKAKAAGTPNVTVQASQATIAFDALGRVTPAPADDITIAVANPTGGDCIAASGKMRCLTILVTPGGQARMCDPAVSDSSDNRHC